jgi:UMP-CMP kinase
MQSTKSKVLFVLGGPGSGKGTQCDNLVGRFGFVHLSAGDLLRAEVKSGSELGNTINSYITKGEMVPGEITPTLIKNEISKKPHNTVFIIDGYPRNQSNIDCWEKIIKDDVEIVGCLFLRCGEEVMKKRLMKRGESSGRSDDNEEVIINRVKVYNEETVPILADFSKNGTLYDVSAEGTIDECFSLCKDVIRNLKLEKFVKLAEMKHYLAENVDVYIKPLIVYIMKNQPTDVHESIITWMNNEGLDIKRNLENQRHVEEHQQEQTPVPVQVEEQKNHHIIEQVRETHISVKLEELKEETPAHVEEHKPEETQAHVDHVDHVDHVEHVEEHKPEETQAHEEEHKPEETQAHEEEHKPEETPAHVEEHKPEETPAHVEEHKPEDS